MEVVTLGSNLSKAFAIAHRLSINPHVPAQHRQHFRQIADLIWKGCGLDKQPKRRCAFRTAHQGPHLWVETNYEAMLGDCTAQPEKENT